MVAGQYVSFERVTHEEKNFFFQIFMTCPHSTINGSYFNFASGILLQSKNGKLLNSKPTKSYSPSTSKTIIIYIFVA